MSFHTAEEIFDSFFLSFFLIFLSFFFQVLVKNTKILFVCRFFRMVSTTIPRLAKIGKKIRPNTQTKESQS